MTWLATAATPLSTSPASTSSARSERRCLMSVSSACGRPRPPRLPPFAPWRRRSSAWSGLWFQHHSEPPIALPLHLSPLALIAVHLLNRAHPLPPSFAVGSVAGVVRPKYPKPRATYADARPPRVSSHCWLASSAIVVLAMLPLPLFVSRLSGSRGEGHPTAVHYAHQRGT